jgi:hypothetical protein
LKLADPSFGEIREFSDQWKKLTEPNGNSLSSGNGNRTSCADESTAERRSTQSYKGLLKGDTMNQDNGEIHSEKLLKILSL